MGEQHAGPVAIKTTFVEFETAATTINGQIAAGNPVFVQRGLGAIQYGISERVEKVTAQDEADAAPVIILTSGEKRPISPGDQITIHVLLERL
jgi:hypothetical protein